MIFLKQVAAMSGVPMKTTLIAVPPRGKNNVPFFQEKTIRAVPRRSINYRKAGYELPAAARRLFFVEDQLVLG
jgi:hypothetical protein